MGSNPTFQKRQKELARKERQAAKAARKAQRKAEKEAGAQPGDEDTVGPESSSDVNAPTGEQA